MQQKKQADSRMQNCINYFVFFWHCQSVSNPTQKASPKGKHVFTVMSETRQKMHESITVRQKSQFKIKFGRFDDQNRVIKNLESTINSNSISFRFKILIELMVISGLNRIRTFFSFQHF